MTLATIKKLDQQNRLHIPTKYLQLCGIDENSEVLVKVICNKDSSEIRIQRLDDQWIKSE